MTKYAGEEYLIVHQAWDFDEESGPLTPADVDDVTVRIVGPAGTDVLAERSMIWDEPALRWTWKWKSPTGAGGTYKVRCTVWGPDGGQAIEMRRVRLASDALAG